MTASRPDLLPFALPDTIGLPYHGLVKNGNGTSTPVIAGTLYHGSSTRSYPQPYDGATLYIQHSKAAALTRTETEQAHDTARDREWLIYALLSGRKHQIGGKDLGEHAFLYCDDTYTWQVRFEMVSGTGTCRLNVYLTELFGVFSDADLSMSERLLATYSWSPVGYDGRSTSSIANLGNRYLATCNKTGSKFILNVGTTTSTSAFRTTISTQGNVSFRLHDALRVTFSGNGSIVPGSVGTGISATIAHVAWCTDMYEYSYTSNSTYEPGATSWEETIETYTTDRYQYVTDKNGNETNAEYYDYSLRYAYIEPPGVVADLATASYLHRLTFGGNTYDSVSSWSGANNVGTLTTNGVDESIDESGASATYYGHAPDGDAIARVLPQVIIFCGENLDPKIMTAGGSFTASAYHPDDAVLRYWTHNPATDATQSHTGYICYV